MNALIAFFYRLIPSSAARIRAVAWSDAEDEFPFKSDPFSSGVANEELKFILKIYIRDPFRFETNQSLTETGTGIVDHGWALMA